MQQLQSTDVVFLQGVTRAERRTTRTGVTGRLVRGGARAGTLSRAWLRRLATLVLLLVATSGLLAGAAPASAGILEPNTWCDRKVFAPERADEGLVGAVLEDEYRDRTGRGNPPSTKWAQYGAAGTTWSTFWLDCLDWRKLINEAANEVFSLSRTLSAIAILIFMWTFKGTLLDVSSPTTTRSPAARRPWIR